jgi:hypothetical protein
MFDDPHRPLDEPSYGSTEEPGPDLDRTSLGANLLVGATVVLLLVAFALVIVVS